MLHYGRFLFDKLRICFGLCYVLNLNTVFGFRNVIFKHFGVTALPFAGVILVWDEFRKKMIRNIKQD